MKLRIIDTFWGVGPKGHAENEVANVVFDVKVGELPPVGPSRQVFKIEEVRENGIVLFLNPKRGNIEIECGKPYVYHPMSMDGGHIFRFELE